MAGSFVPAVSATVTAATAAGRLTVASTTGFYPSMVGWANDGAGHATKLKILSVPDTTHLFVQIVIDSEGWEANSNSTNNGLDNRFKAPSYSFSDVSGLNVGYTLYCESQFIYATNLTQTF